MVFKKYAQKEEPQKRQKDILESEAETQEG